MINIPHLMVAMITPFTVNNEIDYNAVEKIIEHLIQEGVEGIVLCGTTGECSTLSVCEKLSLLKKVMYIVNSRIQIWMGCGTNDTHTTVDLVKLCSNQAIDGIMVITPYYNRPSQQGLYEHFKCVALSTDLPIMIYNVPKRTGVNITSETVIQLCNKYDNIVALKQAGTDFEDTKKIIRDSNCIVLSGDDAHYLEGLQIGMEGIISVVGHLYAPLLKQVYDNYERDLDLTCDSKLKKISKACFLFSSPSEIKYLCSKAGLCEEIVRLPLVTCNTEQKQQINTCLYRISQ